MGAMFADALARGHAAPLITHYSPEARIELSGVTFHNWVMKTANLLEDLGADADEPVALGLLETHPGHWVTAVWCAAVWFAGGSVVAGVPDDAPFVVVGPEDDRRGDVTVACSLHPLGLGFPTAPEGCTDYAEVLAQPDIAVGFAPEPDAPAFDGVTHAELAAVPGRADRRLFTDPDGTWPYLRDAVVAPILGGGSTVVTVGLDVDAVARAAAAEKVSG